MLPRFPRPNSITGIIRTVVSVAITLCSLHLILALLSPTFVSASSLPEVLPRQGGTSNDLLVIYVYHETENALANARYFIEHGLHSKADFLFVLNGPSTLENEIPTQHPNVQVRSRDNSCYDLGTYGQVLNENNGERIQRYSKFILLNASIRGPFVPAWSKTCWTTAYTNMITGNVKMAGMTYSCQPPWPHHIQSMILVTDQIGIRIMLDTCLSVCAEDHGQGVECETKLTEGIRNAGYSVDAMMAAYQAVKDNDSYDSTCTPFDPNFDKAYYGSNLHPYEALFIKANRNIDPAMIDSFTKWHGQMNYPSWESCS